MIYDHFTPVHLYVIKVSKPGTQAAPVQNQKCSELQTLRNCLGKRQPLEADRINLGGEKGFSSGIPHEDGSEHSVKAAMRYQKSKRCRLEFVGV
jgi:hypothetical protein